jgi:hypothetical protein
MRSLMRNLGVSIGISIFEVLLIQNTQIVHSRLVEQLLGALSFHSPSFSSARGRYSSSGLPRT